MKSLDFMTLFSVFQEMLGGFLWVLLLLIIGGTLAFFGLLLREGRIHTQRLVRSQIFGFFGGFLALFIMAQASASGFSDAGGPADWFLIGVVFGLGAIGGTIILYTVLGWRNPIPQ